MGPGELWQHLQGQLLFVLFAVAGAAFLPGRSVGERLGLVRGRLGAGRAALALLGFLVLSNLLHGILARLGVLEGTTLAEIDRTARTQAALHPGWLWLAFGLGPALGEELLFRGCVQRLLALRWRTAWAVLGSAVAFAAAHLDLVHGGAAFVLGGALGVLTARARSLWPAIVSHAANNSLALASSVGLLPPAFAPPTSVGGLALELVAAALCLGLALRPERLQGPPRPAEEQRTPQGPT